MKTKLIEALRKTIEVLKTNPEKYKWTDSKRCNCGLIAEQIMGKTVIGGISQYSKDADPERSLGPWQNGALLCEQMGRPINEVYGTLFKAGMSVEDICNLEHLTDINILKKLGLEKDRKFHPWCNSFINFNRNNIDYLIKYLTAWIEILQEEQKEIEHKTVYRVVEVKIDERVNELKKCVIFN